MIRLNSNINHYCKMSDTEKAYIRCYLKNRYFYNISKKDFDTLNISLNDTLTVYFVFENMPDELMMTQFHFNKSKQSKSINVSFANCLNADSIEDFQNDIILFSDENDYYNWLKNIKNKNMTEGTKNSNKSGKITYDDLCKLLLDMTNNYSLSTIKDFYNSFNNSDDDINDDFIILRPIINNDDNTVGGYLVDENYDIDDIRRCKYMAYAVDPSKLFRISRISRHLIKKDVYNINIYVNLNSNKNNEYRCVKNSDVIMFSDTCEWHRYLDNYNKKQNNKSNTDMDNLKKDFEQFARMFNEYYGKNDSNVFDDLLDLAKTVINLNDANDTEKKSDVKTCTCKKSDTSCCKNNCNTNTNYSFSMSTNNRGIHVYCADGKYFINDKEVTKNGFDNAVEVFNGTGSFETKINSIYDILNEEQDAKNADNKRISDLEAQIKRMQDELASLKNK